MEILGIGASELVFVVIIALIVLGPKDMQKAGRTIGKWMRDIVTSDGWKAFQKTSNEIRKLPTQLMREANQEFDKFNREINTEINLEKGPIKPPRSVSTDDSPASKPDPNLSPSDEQENTIMPSPPPPTDESTDSEKHD